MREEHAEAWREGNNHLFEHYKAAATDLPDNLEEMAPLFAAVAHGCAAGRHQETLDEVYMRRIQRGEEAFNTHKLGAIGAELAALSSFFDSPWHRPVDSLAETDKGYVLNQAGYNLRALGRLKEAAEPMRASLGVALALEHWTNAAISASNLSDNYLNSGNLPESIEFAEQSLESASKSDIAFQRMVNRVTLGNALHQVGRVPETETFFHEGEAMQREQQPEYPLLYTVQGYFYCDLLLAQGKYREVRDRAEKYFEWRVPSDSLLDIALDHLSLGRAHLAEMQEYGTGDFFKAANHLDQAVNGLRNAGTQHRIPHGLLARAALRRARDDFERAQHDLDEAMSIAERGGMGLHQADTHLEYARLYLAMGDKPKAREYFTTAREMIERMGYHRRDDEVAELEEQIGAA